MERDQKYTHSETIHILRGKRGQSETVCLHADCTQRTCLVYTFLSIWVFGYIVVSLFNLPGFANIFPKVPMEK